MSSSRVQQLIADLRAQTGQTMAEYAVILAVITIGIIAAVTALSGGIGGASDKVVALF